MPALELQSNFKPQKEAKERTRKKAEKVRGYARDVLTMAGVFMQKYLYRADSDEPALLLYAEIYSTAAP